MSDYSHIANAHPSYIANLYADFQSNPDAVSEDWQQFFSGFDYSKNGEAGSTTDADLVKEFGVLSIIHGFRDRGHLLSTTNPIKKRRDRRPHLDLTDYDLEEADLGKVFYAGTEIGLSGATLQQILDRLRLIYAGNIGYEYAHIERHSKRSWVRQRIEATPQTGDFGLSLETKKRILKKLNEATVFEEFLDKKYVGQKRFSLEGGETTIPALDAIINTASINNVKEVVIGMAHRGRLNVLVNIMGKTYKQIFSEFEGIKATDQIFGDGDVKYHLGYSSQVDMPSGKKVDLKLVPNPSHLESVNAVVEGFSRAKADLLYESNYDQILPILIHGDAAIAGQGVMYEVVQMSQLDGYHTGGTIHFVINNQVGFTTDFDDARSSTYCTDLAKSIQAPAFHVNGDDPEAVIYAVQMAVEYRQKFHTDVFIDMVCYRKHGHNEGDDPRFTQPHMYKQIKNHPTPRFLYSEKLAARNEIEKQLSEQMEEEFKQFLQDRLDKVRQEQLPYTYQEPEQAWRQLKKDVDETDFAQSPKTGVSRDTLDTIYAHLMQIPEDFDPISKVNRLMKSKSKLLDNDEVDWAYAELAAYGSLLMEGKNVRMSGQDCRRGTFSHRHAVFHDVDSYEEYNRLNGLAKDDSRFSIYNSLLSEFAVMGFEYGYAMATPDALVLWEAQFGDFYNGAQVIVDQYLTAAESKWRRQSGLVLLLPHGYEGQGPEHSSARLERFLQQCADFNIIVANVTTPANFFHLIRRQMAWDFRKPLIVMSPKSLLRHPKVVSKIDEMAGDHRFQELLDEQLIKTAATKVKRLLLCSGKVYYDLLEKREAEAKDDVAILRLEQLYPLPDQQIDKLLKKYKNAERFWVQEESENMGGWRYFAMAYGLKNGFEYIGRTASASPATGYKWMHEETQNELLDKAIMG